MYLTISSNSGWVGGGSLYLEILMGGEPQAVLVFQVKERAGAAKICAFHCGGVDFFFGNNPLRSYNLGQKCSKKRTLPCLVLR